MTFRDRFAAKLGVSEQRKADIYLELSRSTTLTDPSYWLQTLFAAGIATLGLVLNSPAVIIGAMLISPLMGPILASGLALATGDLILGIRSALNLLLSCLLAVGFAFLLVSVLPFKEITNEIAVRTHPTTLDLAVAFFSGAIGSIATCKEVKGVVTSIPGVAIAVALMPPLGVVGYGAAVGFSLSREEGMQVALGGGLLFLTNLVAITFTAMVVFLSLHFDSPKVQGQMQEWHRTDGESIRFGKLFGRMPGVPGVRHIGTLPARLLMILVIILIILIPLSRSFNQLRQELSAQKRENRVRQVVTQTWQKQFGKMSNGEIRSFLDHIFVTDQADKLTLQLRVLTSKPLNAAEKDQFNRALTSALARPRGSVETQIVEVPTTAAAMRLSAPVVQSQLPQSIEQLQTTLVEKLEHSFAGFYFPPPARFVDYQLLTQPPGAIELTVSYLSDRDIDPDAVGLIQVEIRRRLDYPDAIVRLIRVPAEVGIVFDRSRNSTLDRRDQETLDKAAGYLTQHAKLRLEIIDAGAKGPDDKINEERTVALKRYVSSRWQVAPERVVSTQAAEGQTFGSIRLSLIE